MTSASRRIDLGRWRSLAGYGHFALRRDAADAPTFCQFSGGSTSAFLACMSPDEVVLSFQNTGREHERTLEFVREVGEALGREVLWLEFRPPKQKGAPPREFQWARVDFKTAARRGEPFAEFMRCINEYRATKGEPDVSPWAGSRICTVHLKHRVLDHYQRSTGIDADDRWVGLRADEPERVYGLRRQQTRDRGLFAPLFDAGVTKADVLEFWSRQSFDLGIPEHDGNCDGCFLKDQADIARAIGDRPEAVKWWGGMQERYARFGGETHVGYRQLAAELPARLAMEEAFRLRLPLADTFGLSPRRFNQILRQEKKRYEEGPKRVSCSCEASMTPEGDDA